MQVPGLEIDVDVARVEWRPTRVAGVDWVLLASEGGDGGRGARAGATVLIRMAPGRGYPPHRHLDVEEVLILRGGYRDEAGTHRAGSYLRYPAGSAHAPVALGDPAVPESDENPACVLFACARGGIESLETVDPPGSDGSERDPLARERDAE